MLFARAKSAWLLWISFVIAFGIGHTAAITPLLLSLAAFDASAHEAYPEDDGHAPATFSASQLESVRQRLRTGDEHLQPAYRALLARADRLLLQQPYTVLDKSGLAHSGDKHDFYSIGKYSWRSESAPGAYVRIDGARNPEAKSDIYDKRRFNETVRAVNTLALAYYFSGDHVYARKAGDFLRAWFINPETRMRPNFRYAASLPGVSDGMFYGIIEGVVLIEMLDHITLLSGSDALSSSEEDELRKWFLSLAEWLVASDFGKRESRAKNNHGAWYYAQVMSFYLFGGETNTTLSFLPEVRRQLRSQFAPDGSMPRELARADPDMYSVYGLRAFITLARITDSLGASLWFEGEPEPTILNALRFLKRVHLQEYGKTQGGSIAQPDPYAVQLYRLGAEAYRTDEFSTVLKALINRRSSADRYARLMGPTS
jgi:Alginate lyase.